MRRIGGLALILAGLAGCRTGVPYARPALDLPDAHLEAEATGPATARPTASLADLPWWEVFRDPALKSLLKDTLSSNHDLALAAARVQESRALIGLAHSERMPQVEGSLGLSRNQATRDLVPVGDRTSNTYAASVGASWELDLWGRVRNGERAAIADYVASEEGRKAAAVSLVAAVAEGYVRLRTNDLLLEITQRTVGTRRSTLDLFEKRLGGGLSSRLEVARAAGDLAQSQADLPRLSQAIALQEHALSLLAGRNPGPVERGAALGADLVPPEVPAGLPSGLLERRPDVLAAEQRLRAATARVGVAKAEWFPRLSLTALLGLESRELSDLISGDALRWSLGGELLAPLVSGGRLCANERAAWARLEQARQAYLQVVRTSLKDVADALVVIRRSREIRQELEKLAAAREEALKMAFTRFDGGLASYIEVLDSQRELFPAELQLADARRDELIAVIQLYRALGGGWQGALEASCRCGAPPVAPALPTFAPRPAPASASAAAPPAGGSAGPTPPSSAPPTSEPVDSGAPKAPPEPPSGTAFAFPPPAALEDPRALPPAGPLPAAPVR